MSISHVRSLVGGWENAGTLADNSEFNERLIASTYELVVFFFIYIKILIPLPFHIFIYQCYYV